MNTTLKILSEIVLLLSLMVFILTIVLLIYNSIVPPPYQFISNVVIIEIRDIVLGVFVPVALYYFKMLRITNK